MWEPVFVKECPKSKWITYPKKFVPSIRRTVNINLGSFKEIGLVFHRRQLRVVSCHKQTAQWIFKLQPLVTQEPAFSISLDILIRSKFQ